MKTTSIYIGALLGLASVNALAGATCAAETYSGKVALVTIQTVGTMGSVQGGTVQVVQGDKILTAYDLSGEEITQYFETCINGNCEQNNAIIGLAAYEDHNFDVSLTYVGKDYFEDSRDLMDILQDRTRKKFPGNKLRIWNGDVNAEWEKAFYEFKDIVCSLDHDV
jgi:hypothetical protein